MLFSYAVLLAVPRADRGEHVNVGVLLYCQDADLLACRTRLSRDRLVALDALVDADAVEEALAAVARTCAGLGPAGSTGLGQRFRWLTSPRSTVLRTGSVHSGLATDPSAELERLFATLLPDV